MSTLEDSTWDYGTDCNIVQVLIEDSSYRLTMVRAVLIHGLQFVHLIVFIGERDTYETHGVAIPRHSLRSLVEKEKNSKVKVKVMLLMSYDKDRCLHCVKKQQQMYKYRMKENPKGICVSLKCDCFRIYTNIEFHFMCQHFIHVIEYIKHNVVYFQNERLFYTSIIYSYSSVCYM